MNPIQFVAGNAQEKWRWDSLKTKEPGTVRWIETHVQPGDIFYDIGANVGVYTLLAAQHIGAGTVYAFEPHVPTAKSLLVNVSLNDCGKRVQILTCALHHTSGFYGFYYRKMQAGTSGHQLGHTVGEYGDSFDPVAMEWKHATTLRWLMNHHVIKSPTLIKLDVDGNELAILHGLGATRLAPRLRSVQVEVHPKDEKLVCAFMGTLGFQVAEHHYTAIGQQALDRGVAPDQVAHNVIFLRRARSARSCALGRLRREETPLDATPSSGITLE